MPAPTLNNVLVRVRALEAAIVGLIAKEQAPKKVVAKAPAKGRTAGKA